jgi:hypothetical protein
MARQTAGQGHMKRRIAFAVLPGIALIRGEPPVSASVNGSSTFAATEGLWRDRHNKKRRRDDLPDAVISRSPGLKA